MVVFALFSEITFDFLMRASLGVGHAPSTEASVRKSISHERTFRVCCCKGVCYGEELWEGMGCVRISAVVRICWRGWGVRMSVMVRSVGRDVWDEVVGCGGLRCGWTAGSERVEGGSRGWGWGCWREVEVVGLVAWYGSQ